MAKKVMCVKESNLAITACSTYEVLDEDKVTEKVKIIDDNNQVIWVDIDCFKPQ